MFPFHIGNKAGAPSVLSTLWIHYTMLYWAWLKCKIRSVKSWLKCDFKKYLISLCIFFLKVMPLPHIVPRRGWKSCNALANHTNGVGVHSKKHILLPRGSIPCNNGSNNLTPSQFKQKSKISGSINHHTIKDSSMWKKIQKVKWNRIEVY